MPRMFNGLYETVWSSLLSERLSFAALEKHVHTRTIRFATGSEDQAPILG